METNTALTAYVQKSVDTRLEELHRYSTTIEITHANTLLKNLRELPGTLPAQAYQLSVTLRDFLVTNKLARGVYLYYPRTGLVVGNMGCFEAASYYALQGVPQDVQEAATIDGASALQRFRFITLPLISGSFTICFTLSLINGLKVFDQIAVMTDGGPGFATETIVYLLYKSGFGEGRQGYGTAVGVVLLFIILILNNIQSAILRKREVQL